MKLLPKSSAFRKVSTLPSSHHSLLASARRACAPLRHHFHHPLDQLEPRLLLSVAFAPKIDYATGASPVAITVADFNHDSKMDLAVANRDAGTVSILFNNGDGTFAPKIDYPAGAKPSWITAADFNHDDLPDLVVTNANDGTVSILLNNGDGTFAPKVTYATGANPTWVTAADFNGDGMPDLAVTNFLGNTVSILLNNGDGTFAPKTDFATGTSPVSVAAADFNHDGHIDLAVANFDGTLSILVNNGSGSFATQTTLPTGLWPSSIAAADLNGDTFPDLVVSNWHDSTVSVFLNNGDGTFAPQATYATGTEPNSVIAADFNHDGHLDLAVATLNPNGNTVSLLLNNGDGTFAPKVDFAAGIGPYSVAAADFSADGHTDLALVNKSTNVVSVLLNSVGIVGPATHLAFPQPLPNIAGPGVSPPLVILIQDAAGNIVTTDNSSVTIALATNPKSAKLTGTLTVTAVNGVATFPGLSLSKTGAYTLRASDSALTLAVSNAFTVGAKLAFFKQPASTVAGLILNNSSLNNGSFQVLIQDASGHTLTTDNSAVTLTIATGPAGSTLGGTVTVNAVNGIATFNNLTLTKAGSYKLLATDGAIKTTTSRAFTVAPAAPTQLINTQDASNTVAGVKMNPVMSFQLLDAFGNLTTNIRPTLTASIHTGPLGSILTGTVSTKFNKGLASFKNLTLKMAGTYTLHVAVGGLSFDSSSFTVTPAAAKKLVFVQQPTNALVGVELTPDIAIKLVDAFGNLTTSSANITLSQQTGRKGALITTTVAATSGVATFTHLSLSLPGTYKLKAATPGLGITSSVLFTIL